MTNLRKIAMAVAIIAVFTTFVGCGKTQQEAVEATTEQVADDTQEQAVEATTQEQAAEAATEQAVEADTQEEAAEVATEQTAEAATQEAVEATDDTTIIVFEDDSELTIKVESSTSIVIINPDGSEVKMSGQFPEEPLPTGRISIRDVPFSWDPILRAFNA